FLSGFWCSGSRLSHICCSRSRPAHILRRPPREESIGNAKLDLVCIGDGVNIIKTDYAIEVIDTRYLAVNHIGLNHMAKEKGAATAIKIFRQSWWSDIELKLAVRSGDVLA